MREITRPGNDVFHEGDVSPKASEPEQEIAEVMDDFDRENALDGLKVREKAKRQDAPCHRNDRLFGYEFNDEHA